MEIESQHLRPSVLLVEDDARLAHLVSRYLEGHGYETTVQHDPAIAEQIIHDQQPNLVLLDIGLGATDGLDICRRVRSSYHGILCIFSARADDIHQVLGLELGADDFITKPTEPRVLLARLRAHLRRGTSAKPLQRLTFGGLQLDLQERRTVLDGRPIALTTAEFDLLVLLARNAGTIMDRDALMRRLRRIGFDGMDRSIDARVSRLRRKLGDTGTDAVRIKTVRGQGYLFSRTGWG